MKEPNSSLPHIGSRSAIIGKTGSGKTYLARHIIQGMIDNYNPSIVIIDPKGTFDSNFGNKVSVQIVEYVEEIDIDNETDIIHYKPPIDADNDFQKQEYQKLFIWIMKRGNTLLYIDELYALSPNGTTLGFPSALRSLYTRGREFNVTIIACTQQPCSIPSVCYTECEYFYVFKLQKPEDRKRMREIMGSELNTMAEGYNFWHTNPKTDVPVYSTLRK